MASERIRLRTVGIDIGTTTSHLVFSQLVLERQGLRLSSAYAVSERRIIHRSEIALTPYATARRIDTEALGAFIARAYEQAGWSAEMVDSGAVIATGEAARAENAAAIVALFSGQAGRFVCATAGHHLESLLAAHGSGAVALSRSGDCPLVLNVDIGGGTTKLAVCRGGRVQETAAVDLGARVIAWDERGTVRAITAAGRYIADGASVRIAAGDRPARADLERIAARVAELVMRIPAGLRLDDHLWLTEPLAQRGPFPVLVVSGGVGEYLTGAQRCEFGDLGVMIAAAISRGLGGYLVVRPLEAIRATCIGASLYTIQVSGDTLFVTAAGLLPLRDLAAIAIDPDRANAAEIAHALRAGVTRLDRQNGSFAIAVRWRHGPAYAALRELAAGIRDGVGGVLPAGRPLVVVLDADVAGIVGQILKDELGVTAGLICVDQIALSDLDFIDIGAEIPDKGVVPVVVKSLVFAER